VPAIELRKISHRGGLDHAASGLYRFADIPIAEFDLIHGERSATSCTHQLEEVLKKPSQYSL
jgi:hypothetical protein